MRSRIVLLAAMAFVFNSGAGTAHAAADKLYGNITEGHVGVDSSVSFTSTSVASAPATNQFAMRLRGQYFLEDRIALGPAIHLNTRNSFTSLRIGPSVLGYFWARDRLGAYISEDVTIGSVYQSGASSSRFDSDTVLGINYFITPSVALGPAIELFHVFGNVNFDTINEFLFTGAFSIYL
jgi:hypothetical protein